jgi:DNA-binding Lrp family transcriptional regulator
MVSAYVFMKFGAGAPVEIIAAIRNIPGVKQAHVVTGPDDVIAYVEAESKEDLEKIIMSMRKVAVVTSSDTRITWSL